MIRNNLAVILADRRLRITKVSKDTGLSRTTLTAIAQNENKRLDNDTLNTLCLYLGITPEEFYSFFNFDLKFEIKFSPFVVNVLKSQKYYPYTMHFIQDGTKFGLSMKIKERYGEKEYECQGEILPDKGSIGFYTKILSPEEVEVVSDGGAFVFRLVHVDEELSRFFGEKNLSSGVIEEIKRLLSTELQRAFDEEYMRDKPNGHNQGYKIICRIEEESLDQLFKGSLIEV